MSCNLMSGFPAHLLAGILAILAAILPADAAAQSTSSVPAVGPNQAAGQGTARPRLSPAEYTAKRLEWQRLTSERQEAQRAAPETRSVEARQQQEECLAPFAHSMRIEDAPGLWGVIDHREIDAIPMSESDLVGRFLIQESGVFLSEKKNLIYTVLEARVISRYKGAEGRRVVTILNPGGKFLVESGGVSELRFEGRAQPGLGPSVLFLRGCGEAYVLLAGYEVRPGGLLPMWVQPEHVWFLGKNLQDLETAIREAMPPVSPLANLPVREANQGEPRRPPRVDPRKTPSPEVSGERLAGRAEEFRNPCLNMEGFTCTSTYLPRTDAAEAADLVFSGFVLNEAAYLTADRGGVYTEWKVRVIEGARGRLRRNSIVQVLRQGGTVTRAGSGDPQEETIRFEGDGFLAPGTPYVFFARRSTWSAQDLLLVTACEVVGKTNRLRAVDNGARGHEGEDAAAIIASYRRSR